MRRAMIMKWSAGLALLLGIAVLSYLEAQPPPTKGKKGTSRGFGRSPEVDPNETPSKRSGFGRSTETTTPSALDVSLASVTVEVVIGEWNAAKKEEKEDSNKKLDELTGPSGRVEEALKALQKSGRVTRLRRIRVSGQDGQRSQVMVGESRAYVMGVARAAARFGGAAGVTTSNINYRDVGTTLTVTPRVSSEAILLDLQVEHSGVREPDNAPVLGTSDNGQAIKASSFTNTRLATRVKVPTGQTVLARSATSEDKDDSPQLFILVTARASQPARDKP